MNFMINQLVKDWAWQVNDGMPDPKDRTHLEVLEAVLKQNKYSEEFIQELIHQIKNPILEKTGDTSATTLFHEVITGIFVANPGAKIATGEDVLGYFKNGTIKAVNSSLGVVAIESLSQARYLNAKTFPKPSIISDAKSLASKIRSKFGTASIVWWTGPTNDASKFGAADIVVDKKYGISLKYGAGQLKNLTVNTFAQTVLGSNPNVNVMKDIMKTYSGEFDKMTTDWVALFVNEVKLTKNKLAIKLAKSIASSTSTWDSYQKKKLKLTEIELLVNALKITSLNVGKTEKQGVRYLIKKLFEIKKWPQWQKTRNTYFNTIFGGYFRSIEDNISNGLGKLFKKQLSVQENDLYYAAKGGKDFKYIPGEKAFDKLTSRLQFTYQYNPSGSGYEFVLNILNEAGKPLGSISIKFRWKDGQMNGTIITTSDAKWVVKDWSEIIPGAK